MQRGNILSLMNHAEFWSIAILAVLITGLTACTPTTACSTPARYGFEEDIIDSANWPDP
jgi:hypothetical protein